MGDTEVKQNQELDQLKDTLGNKKLDTKEVNFLKSQKELLLDFKQETETKLLTDIKETNKISFAKNEKVRTILNSFWMKPDGFVDQLVNLGKLIYKDKKNIDIYKANLKLAIKETPDDFTKQSIMLNILFDADNTGKVNNDFVYNIATKKQKTENIFDVNLVKNIHKFQSQYASASSTKGRSEADCIVGYRTVQQLCNKVGVNPTVGTVEIDSKFSQSNFKAKEKYSRANESQGQIDIILADKGLNNLQKVKSMVEVCKKTTTKAKDGTDKRYAAVAYMISNIQIMMPNIGEPEKQAIIQELSGFSSEIKKYWNEQNSNSKIKKSNDFLNDLNKGIEQKNENFKKFGVIHSLCKVRYDYYDKEEDNDDVDIQNKNKMKKALSIIESFQNRITPVSQAEIKLQLDRVFVSTMEDNTITLGADTTQKAKLETIKTYLLGFTESTQSRKNETKILNLRTYVIGEYRSIDKKFDSIMPRAKGLSGGDAIVNNILEQDKSGFQGLGTMTIKSNGDKTYEKFNSDTSSVDSFFVLLDIADPTAINTIDKITAQLKLLASAQKKGDNKLRYSSIITIKDIFKKTLALSHIDINNDDAIIKLAENFRKSEEALSNKKAETRQAFQSQIDEGIKELEGDLAFYEKELTYNPTNQEYLTYKNQISEKLKELKSGKIGEKTKEESVNQLTDNLTRISFINLLQSSAYDGLYNDNYAAINKLRDKPNPTNSEKTILMYSNIMGKGGYTSDNTYNKILEVTKEIIIQVAICAISAGVGSLVMKGAVSLTKRAVKGIQAAKYANKIGKYAQLAEMGFTDIARGTKILEQVTEKGIRYTKAVKNVVNTTNEVRTLTGAERIIATGTKIGTSIVEGGAFHVSSTILNNAIQGIDITQGLNPFGIIEIKDPTTGKVIDKISNFKGYVQSIAFLGVIKELGGVFGNISQKFLNNTITQTEIKNTLSQTIKLTGKKIAISTASFGSELASMGLADQIISLGFDQKFKEMSVKDTTQMVGMILGLRLTHKLNPLNKLNHKLDEYIIKDFTRDANGNVGDVKILSGGEEIWLSQLKLNEIANKSPQHEKVIQEHQSGEQHVEKSDLPGKDKSDIKREDTKQKVEIIEKSENLNELKNNINKVDGVNAYKETGDKQFVSSPEIMKALESGNFEALNFQKGDAMLELRKKGVEFYVNEKIQSVNDMIDFVSKNPKLFGGKVRQAKLIEELQRTGKTDEYKLTQFNKKVQSYQEISGPNSKSGFDMKSIIDKKINDINNKSKEPMLVKEEVVNKEVKEEPVIKNEEPTKENNQPVKIEIPQELLTLDGIEFKSEIGKIEDLNNIGNYEIARVETNDGGYYILKPLDKGEYEVVGGNPQLPKGQKVLILEGEKSIRFPKIPGNKLSFEIKSIKEVDLLKPVTKNEVAVMNEPFIREEPGVLLGRDKYGNPIVKKETTKKEPVKKETKQEPVIKNDEVLRDENNEPIRKEDLVNMDEPLTSPKNKTKLEKLIIELEKDPTVPKAINREKFVIRRGEKEIFDTFNRRLLNGLEKTLIRNGDVVVSRNGEKFEISVDENGKAFLQNPNDINKRTEFTETMIDNYKVVKRATETGKKGFLYGTKRVGDRIQLNGRWIGSLLVKYPKKFIKTIENSVSEVKSLFQSPDNPNITKINKYNFIFREETLGNNPQNLLKKSTYKKGGKFIFNNSGTSPNVEFSYYNWKTCESIRKTSVQENDLIVDKKGKEFVAKSEGGKTNLYGINADNLGTKIELTENKISEYRVVRREGARNLGYINGRITDFIANNIPLSNIAILGGRDILNKGNKLFGKNELERQKIVEKNANLNDQDRIKEAKKLLPKLNITTQQEQAIIQAHNIGADREGASIYNYTQTEILQKTRILNEAGFTSKQIRILLENGICGKIETSVLDDNLVIDKDTDTDLIDNTIIKQEGKNIIENKYNSGEKSEKQEISPLEEKLIEISKKTEGDIKIIGEENMKTDNIEDNFNSIQKIFSISENYFKDITEKFSQSKENFTKKTIDKIKSTIDTLNKTITDTVKKTVENIVHHVKEDMKIIKNSFINIKNHRTYLSKLNELITMSRTFGHYLHESYSLIHEAELILHGSGELMVSKSVSNLIKSIHEGIPYIQGKISELDNIRKQNAQIRNFEKGIDDLSKIENEKIYKAKFKSIMLENGISIKEIPANSMKIENHDKLIEKLLDIKIQQEEQKNQD